MFIRHPSRPPAGRYSLSRSEQAGTWIKIIEILGLKIKGSSISTEAIELSLSNNKEAYKKFVVKRKCPGIEKFHRNDFPWRIRIVLLYGDDDQKTQA